MDGWVGRRMMFEREFRRSRFFRVEEMERGEARHGWKEKHGKF